MAHAEGMGGHFTDDGGIMALSTDQMLSKIVKDLYFGNGQPALTVRVAGIEDQQVVFKEALDDQKKFQATVTKLIIGTLLSSLGGLLAIVFEMLFRK